MGWRVLILDLDPATALHLAVALDAHAKTCRANGLGLPADLVEFASRCWNTARRVSEDLDGQALADLVPGAHSAPMLLTIPEAAAALRLSVPTVKRLVADGTIPSVAIGRARRIRVEDLTTYLDSLRPRSFREAVELKDTPASPSLGPAGRREAGAGTLTPAGVPASLPQGAA